MAQDYKVKDISLAELGRKQIELAEVDAPIPETDEDKVTNSED